MEKLNLSADFMDYLVSENLVSADGEILCSDGKELLQKCNSFVITSKFSENIEDLERYRIVVDKAPCTISWVDSDLNYLGVNSRLADLVGKKPHEFIGQKVGFYTNNKHFRNFISHLFESHLETVYQDVSSKIDGEEKKFWVVGTKFDGGHKAVIIGIDVTETKNLEENVTFLEKLSSLGEMVSGIVHEINGPLSIINIEGRKIGRMAKEHDLVEITEKTEKIKDITVKIGQIIRGVKSFVRQGHKDPFVPCNIFEIIDDARAICEGKLKSAGVELTIEDKNRDLSQDVNLTQIFQVFVNLITNSIDAISGLPEKWIKIVIEEDKVVFSDSGSGIPQDIQEAMFNSFFTTKAAGKGTGLGLSVCKKIMEGHDGDIVIDNDASHTTFHVKFP